MKVLPEKLNLALIENDGHIELIVNDNYKLKYNLTESSNNEILTDLLENNAFATTLLFLNEKYTLDLSENNHLVNLSNINDFYEDCESLLFKNIELVEEVGIPLTDIDGYKIFETENGILRGNGSKKIKESFKESEKDNKSDNLTKSDTIDIESLAWDLVDFAKDSDPYDFKDNYNSKEDAFNQTILDLSYKSGIDGVVAWLNSIKEEADKKSYNDETLESLLTRLEMLSQSLTESIEEDEIKFEYKSSLTGRWHSIPKRYLIKFLGEERKDAETDEIWEEADDALLKCSRNEAFNYRGTIYDPVEYRLAKLKEEGTQVSDIAPKVDQNLGINKPKLKYDDVVIPDLDEALNLRVKGFLKNKEGLYQRGNYILIKEGAKYMAINMNKLN